MKGLFFGFGLVCLFASAAFCQRIPGPGGVSHAAGTSVTANLGAPWTGTATTNDTGNKDYPFAGAFITPPTMSSTSFGPCNVNWIIPDGTNKNRGCAYYSDQVQSGTANTQNASSGSCTANCVTLTSGTSSSYWAGGAIYLGGVPYTISSVVTSTLVQLLLPPGTHSGISYAIHFPNAKLCAAFSSTALGGAGWEALTPSSCPAPTAGTWYWIASVTDSATQGFLRDGNSSQFWPCPSSNSIVFGQQLASFGSITDWPANFTLSSGAFSDGCISQYATLTYTQPTGYAVVNFTRGFCDSGNTDCPTSVIPVTSGSSLLVLATTSATGAPVTAPTDGGDTFTALGSCPATVTGGTASWSYCFYFTPRATAGTSTVTCHTTVLSKDGCFVLEIKGLLASGSYDTSCYDTAVTTTVPYTGCTTSTTSQASELWISMAYDEGFYGTTPSWSSPMFIAGGSWNLIGDGYTDGSGAGTAVGLFQQVSSSTGTCTPSVNEAQSGNNKIFSSCVALR
jgi:hypothetical protein